VFEAMQVYLGSAYINDFNYLGRTYQVIAQADDRFRMTAADIARFKTRNDVGQMVPVGSVARFHDTTGPYRLPRYNQFPAAEVQGSSAPGVSSGTALAAMEELAAQRLPQGVGFEWTDLAYEQKQAGNSTILIFAASVLFVFMVLAAQYESWSLPLSVILIVPMCSTSRTACWCTISISAAAMRSWLRTARYRQARTGLACMSSAWCARSRRPRAPARA
jgi:HAE1 family hydrophobic/amphiphilic exporter-1